MNINFNAVKTLLKKNAKKRPILTCMSYRKDKIIFTDSYSLVEIEASNDVEFNLDVMELRLSGETFPNVDGVKPPKHELTQVSSIVPSLNSERVELYLIDDYPFIKTQIDQTFKTLGINFYKDLIPKDIKLKTRPNHGVLIYETDDVYVLVLGIYKEDEL